MVGSPQWARGSNLRAGAATFADGRVPTAATVSRSNSLVGTSQDDQVGGRISTLNNGNYVVITANWDDPGTGAVNVGAVTWGKGVGGIYGDINDSNSKLGTNTNDRVGSGALRLYRTGTLSSHLPSGTRNAEPLHGARATAATRGAMCRITIRLLGLPVKIMSEAAALSLCRAANTRSHRPIGTTIRGPWTPEQ